MKRWSASVVLAVAGSAVIAAPVELHCDLSESPVLQVFRDMYGPAAGKLVFKVDSAKRSVEHLSGLVSFAKNMRVDWQHVQITISADDDTLRNEELRATNVIRIDRATGDFSLSHEHRDRDGRLLSQKELDDRFNPAPSLFRLRTGPRDSGVCVVRDRQF